MGLFDRFRKPLTITRKGVKKNVMSWKGTVLVPEAGFVTGSVGEVTMPSLPYSDSVRKLYCRTRDVAVGDGGAFVSNVQVVQ